MFKSGLKHDKKTFPRWSSGYDFRLSSDKARETRVRFPVEENYHTFFFFLYFFLGAVFGFLDWEEGGDMGGYSCFSVSRKGEGE